MPIESVPLDVDKDSIHGAMLDVPVGPQHPVYVSAYNGSGLLVYSGNSSVDVDTEGEGAASIFMFSHPQNCPGAGSDGIRIIGLLRTGRIDTASSF
ncbi:hypothetical protein OV208_38390 [Corallococcus sp. bb12-1]|uniref:hypothetical protein n=1 Tax=Corallococcus TaxID=83461 RepID=UPI0011C49614|nr:MULTISPECIES: hypothetical protein [Corallococcus]MCY1047230.1 hypothetical protein [Corallococcus sp. bb12-1]